MNGHLVGTVLVIVASLLPVTAQGAECDAALQAQYEALATEAEGAHDTDGVIKFRRNAAEACSTYANWMRAGDAAAALNAYADAASAYDKAEDEATTAQDKAQAIARYATATFDAGYLNLASTAAQQAREIDPDSEDVRAIGRRIDTHIASHPLNVDDQKRSLDSGFPRLVLQNRVDLAVSRRADRSGSGGPGPARPSTRAQASTPVQASAPRSTPRVLEAVFDRIPDTRINFMVSRAEIDANSWPSVDTLVSMLRNPAYAQHRIVLVAHSDERGDAQRNWGLSVKRAQFVRDEVVRRAPDLAGRISAEGMGETQPRYRNARTEEEHLLNRRLEVVVR